MISQQSQVTLADVMVQATSNRGFTPEEVAERALNKILSVSETAPHFIRDQANAFRSDIKEVLVHYMKEAIKSDRTTLTNKFINSGHPELIELLRT
jgi:hypothetical protein